jgi:hypothetical protein
MARGTIRLTRGDDYSETLSFDESDGSDYDLTGGSVRFTLKVNPGDADLAAVVSHVSGDGNLTITSPATGTVTHQITATETEALMPGVYYYDYQLVAVDSTVATLERGRAEVAADITRTAA